jgi:hypothetical protein
MNYYLQSQVKQGERETWVNINSKPDELRNLIDNGNVMNGYAVVRIIDEQGEVVWQPN